MVLSLFIALMVTGSIAGIASSLYTALTGTESTGDIVSNSYTVSMVIGFTAVTAVYRIDGNRIYSGYGYALTYRIDP